MFEQPTNSYWREGLVTLEQEMHDYSCLHTRHSWSIPGTAGAYQVQLEFTWKSCSIPCIVVAYQQVQIKCTRYSWSLPDTAVSYQVQHYRWCIPGTAGIYLIQLYHIRYIWSTPGIAVAYQVQLKLQAYQHVGFAPALVPSRRLFMWDCWEGHQSYYSY